MKLKRFGMFLAAALAAGALAFAQSEDMMGNGKGHGNGNGNGNGQGQSEDSDHTNYGIGSVGQGMADMLLGPTVGADGVAYVYRVFTPQNSTTSELQLAAIDSAGVVKWFVPITGGTPSAPVLVKDNAGLVRIYITISQRGMDFAPGRRMGQDDDEDDDLQAAAQKAKLLVLAPEMTNKILNTVEVDAIRLSRPAVATDTAGAAGAIYVIGEGDAGRKLFIFRPGPNGFTVTTAQL